LDYKRFKEIADKVGAYAVADVAHIAGMICSGVLKNPFDYGFDVVLTTTHKTLRGPRGGMILCKQELAKKIDKSVFPGFQGGPIMQMIAGKAVAFKEAMKPEFKENMFQVQKNARAMAEEFLKNDVELSTSGTDNHLVLLQAINSWGVPGGLVETTCDKVNITLNKNMYPDDERKPMDPSGVRIGTPAMTTRGVKEEGFKQITNWILEATKNHDNEAKLEEIKKEVKEFCLKYPLPGTNK